jgi:hypothetical protein
VIGGKYNYAAAGVAVALPLPLPLPFNNLVQIWPLVASSAIGRLSDEISEIVK